MNAEFIHRPRCFADLLLPASTVLQDSARTLAYRELVTSVATVADWLDELGAEVVALRADNSIDWLLVDLACQAAGICFIPVPLFFSQQQMEHCLRASRAQWLLGDDFAARDKEDQRCELLPTLVARRLGVVEDASRNFPQGTGKITFTSGSTGEPRGVCLANTQQWLVAQSLADRIAIRRPRHLCLLPLATLLENLAGVYTPMLCGGTVLLPSAASRGLLGSSQVDIPALLSCLEREQPSSLILIPQLLSALVAAREQGWSAPASLRFIAVGGARVSPDLLERAWQLDLPVYEGYGLSECASVVALNTADGRQSGSVGRLLPHCKAGIEAGELVISEPCHLGYLHDPASWYPTAVRSGDLARLDGDGFLYIEGRRKNLLITSFGRNVSPEWVESALLACPELTQAVVFGEGKPALCALVGAPATVSDARIAAWIVSCNQTLPDYARVGYWRRLETARWRRLLTANGRPRRELIALEFAAQAGQLAPIEGVPTWSRGSGATRS